jgi:hypothetical protein
MNYELWYLADQNDDIHGAKVYVGFYASLADAQAKAAADQKAHYSVEKIDAFDESGMPVSSTIVYIQ